MEDVAPKGYVIAGARVIRAFDRADGRVSAGAVISPAEFTAMARASRRVMVKNGHIEPFYVPLGTPGVDVQRHVVHRGAGRYDVIQGTLLTSEWVSKEEAEQLAAQTLPS
jgi:hypothetical protein